MGRDRKDRRLTEKQSVFVAKFTDPKNKKTFLNKRGTMLAMGATPMSAGNSGCLMADKPHVRAAIIEALHNVKITPKYQAKKLKELMEASKPIYHEGLKIDEIPDNEVRHKALVTSLKITDALDNLEGATNNININISPEMCDRLIRISEEMKRMREIHSSQVIPLIKQKENDNG